MATNKTMTAKKGQFGLAGSNAQTYLNNFVNPTQEIESFIQNLNNKGSNAANVAINRYGNPSQGNSLGNGKKVGNNYKSRNGATSFKTTSSMGPDSKIPVPSTKQSFIDPLDRKSQTKKPIDAERKKSSQKFSQ